MDPDFWIQRWQENRIGFHLDEVNPLLLQYFLALHLTAPARIFVPLCGKSVDMLWLRAQGFEVVAVELSTIAVEGFFREQGLTAGYEVIDGMPLWRADGIDIWCVDFFALQPEHLGSVAATYDRAALIAMPPDKRPRYAEQLLRLTAGAPQLLITLAYPQQQMAGPPFSVENDEVIALYEGRYAGAREPVGSVDVLPAHAQFAARGLTALSENVYLLQVPKK